MGTNVGGKIRRGKITLNITDPRLVLLINGHLSLSGLDALGWCPQSTSLRNPNKAQEPHKRPCSYRLQVDPTTSSHQAGGSRPSHFSQETVASCGDIHTPSVCCGCLHQSPLQPPSPDPRHPSLSGNTRFLTVRPPPACSPRGSSAFSAGLLFPAFRSCAAPGRPQRKCALRLLFL